jgi:hypothetical protein
MMESHQAGRWPGADIGGGSHGSDHHQIDPSVFEALLCQTIPRHLFNPIPVLTEIAGSLILGEKLGLQTARLAHISVCDLKKHCLRPLFKLGRCPRPMAHGLFLYKRLSEGLLASETLHPLYGVPVPDASVEADMCKK